MAYHTTAGRRHVLGAALLGIAVFAVATAAPNVQFFEERNVGDTRLYESYGEKVRDGELPYADFYLEYPPAAVPAFVVPTIGSSGGYAERSKWLQWLLGATSIALGAFALSRAGARVSRLYAAAVLVGVSPVFLGRVTFTRFDFWPAALTALALAAAVAQRHRSAAVTLALGTAAKVYPLLLLPLLAVHARHAARKLLVVYAAALVAIVAPFVALGPGGVRFTLTVQLERPLQIESLGGSLLLAAGRLGLYDPTVVTSHGSQNLSGSLPAVVATLTSLIGIAAIAAVWFGFRAGRGGSAELLTAAAAAVTLFVAFGRVLSPQYLLWLIPLVPLARGRRGSAAALLLLGALALTQTWSQGRFGEVARVEPIVWLVFARNLVLVAAAGLLVSELRRPR